MKKMKLGAAIGALLVTTATSAVTMSELTLDALNLVEYNQENLQPYEYPASTEVGKVEFRDFHVSKTDEYIESLEYLEKQSYLNDYQQKAFSKLAFSVAYTLQNADKPELLSRYQETSNMIDFCAFYNVDQSTAFVVERLMTKGIGEDKYLDRFKMGSKKIIDFGTDDFEKRMAELIVHCGSFVDSELEL